jgi:hypothetical protein
MGYYRPSANPSKIRKGWNTHLGSTNYYRPSSVIFECDHAVGEAASYACLCLPLCDVVSGIEGNETVPSWSISLDYPSGLSSAKRIYVVK